MKSSPSVSEINLDSVTIEEAIVSTEVLPRYLATYSIQFVDERIPAKGTVETTDEAEKRRVLKREMLRMTNMTKRQNEIILVILSVVLFFSLAAYSYFVVYVPDKEANDQVKVTTSNERDVLFALRKQAAATEETDMGSSQPLQRKVPTQPFEDAVLLQISKAEIKSGTTVRDVTFSQGVFIIEKPPKHVENVNQLLTEVVLQADSYIEIENFVDEIEKMDRIFIIDSIKFNTPGEIREQESVKEIVEMTISFSSFYRPDLTGLYHEAPKTNAPPPGEKIDPTPYNDGTKGGGFK